MGERKINSIEKVDLERDVETLRNHSDINSNSTIAADIDEIKVRIDFPKPTLLSAVLSKMAKVFDYTFVMEPGLDRRIQVFSHGELRTSDAFEVFAASLGSVGLRLVFINEKTLKIAKRKVIKSRI